MRTQSHIDFVTAPDMKLSIDRMDNLHRVPVGELEHFADKWRLEVKLSSYQPE